MTTPDGLAEWLGCGLSVLGPLPERLNPVEARAAAHRAGWGYGRRVACIGVEKGGVGKTFLAINAAAALVMHGVRVLLMDFDPQCCATNYLLPEDVDAESLSTFLNVVAEGATAILPSRIAGLDLVPARPDLRRLERKMDPQAFLQSLDAFVSDQTFYDVILFDIPPFFGMLSSVCYIFSDLIVLPVTPDAWSIESISLTRRDVLSACAESARPSPAFSVLPNKASPNRRSTGEVLARLEAEYGDILLPFSVHESAGALNAMNDGVTVFSRREAKSLRAPIIALARHICPPVRLGWNDD